jgi:hypothetical protein
MEKRLKLDLSDITPTSGKLYFSDLKRTILTKITNSGNSDKD